MVFYKNSNHLLRSSSPQKILQLSKTLDSPKKSLDSQFSPAISSESNSRHGKMNAQELRATRGIRLRKTLIDLNVAPRDQEGTFAPGGNLQARLLPSSQPVPEMIDVDAIEDDVVESSASDFAEAISKLTGSRRRRLTVGVESGGTTNKRRRVPPNQPVIDCENVPDTSMAPPPPPPEEPKFSCPICMCPFTEEMSTKCGHIFCKGCIKMAISKQGKCPTCRKKVTARELIRVFLPTTR